MFCPVLVRNFLSKQQCMLRKLLVVVKMTLTMSLVMTSLPGIRCPLSQVGLCAKQACKFSLAWLESDVLINKLAQKVPLFHV